MERSLVICILLCVLAALTPLRAQTAITSVPDEAYDRVRAEGSVCVLVDLEDTTSPSDRLSECCVKYERVQQGVLDLLPTALAHSTCKLRYRFRYSPVMLLEIKDSSVLDLLKILPRVKGVRLDQQGSASVNESRVVVGADRAFDELGLTGEGRVVAVLDTGIESTHPDFQGAILHEYHYLDQGAVQGSGAEEDTETGHGINVAGIIVSRGVVSPRGLAPGAGLIAVKVLNQFGRGWIADWTAGIEHVIDLHESGQFHVAAIHMSLGTDAIYSDLCDWKYPEFSNACQAAHLLGISVVSSSGNSSSSTSIEAPGCFENVVSVGAVEGVVPEALADFSNRGSLLDLLAPGEEVVSSGPDGKASTWDGTSQAAPHVTSAVLLLRQIAPSLIPETMRDWLKETGKSVYDSRSRKTYPLLDVYAATQPLVEDTDCDGNMSNDVIDLLFNTVSDCNENRVPDSCEIESNPFLDCNENGLIDPCENESVLCQPRFLRGDADRDTIVDATDATLILSYLFLGNPIDILCRKAADVDDNAAIEMGDAINLLMWFLLGSEEPRAPFPECGFESTPDELQCTSQCF